MKGISMLNRVRKFSEEREQGFTLIELLVVIIIIGILAAIAIPVFLNQRKKGVDAGLKSDLKNAATAAETFITDNPGSTTALTMADLTAGGFKATGTNVVSVSGNPSAGYKVCAYNTGASKATGAALLAVYDSNNGGLQTAGFSTAAATAC